MPKSVPELVYTYDHNRRITTLMTTSRVQQLKPHQKTKITGKRAYLCSHCRGLGHTKPTCAKLLSGNQSIQMAKYLVPGRYIIYEHPDIFDKRNKFYTFCNLRQVPIELHPESSPKQSYAEHSIFKSIAEN